MKLSPLFALAFFLVAQAAMAQPEQAAAPVETAAEVVRVDIDETALAAAKFDDVDDDICWVAPEWREISQ